MANEILKRDQNRVTVIAGVTDDAAQDIVMLRVDPVTFRLKVNAPGVSGLSKLTATGTVNGSNAVFSFSAAPAIVFVDGVPKQKVSSDSTTNWTGTTTITLSIAPVFDIFGL